MYNKLISTVLVWLFVFVSYSYAADYNGPSYVETYDNLKDIITNPTDGQHVTLTGKIIRKFGGDRYLFSGNNYTISIKIDNEDLPTIPFTEESLVKIAGEIRVSYFRPLEIAVSKFAIISQGDISNINVKPDSVAEILKHPEDFHKVRLKGTVVAFTDDDEFILKDEDAYILVDVDGGAKKELNLISEGDFVYVSGSTKLRTFYFRNNSSRPIIKARIVVKQAPEDLRKKL